MLNLSAVFFFLLCFCLLFWFDGFLWWFSQCPLFYFLSFSSRFMFCCYCDICVKLLIDKIVLLFLMGLPRWLSGKASTCNARDTGSIPGSGRSPGEGNGNPHQYSCLENPMDGGAWWATVHGVAKNQTRLSNFTFLFTRPLMDLIRYTHLFIKSLPPSVSKGSWFGKLSECRVSTVISSLWLGWKTKLN